MISTLVKSRNCLLYHLQALQVSIVSIIINIDDDQYSVVEIRRTISIAARFFLYNSHCMETANLDPEIEIKLEQESSYSMCHLTILYIKANTNTHFLFVTYVWLWPISGTVCSCWACPAHRLKDRFSTNTCFWLLRLLIILYKPSCGQAWIVRTTTLRELSASSINDEISPLFSPLHQPCTWVQSLIFEP